MTPHTAALRWVAGQLAWEDRLGTLRDEEELPQGVDSTMKSTPDAVVEELVQKTTTPAPRKPSRAA